MRWSEKKTKSGLKLRQKLFKKMDKCRNKNEIMRQNTVFIKDIKQKSMKTKNVLCYFMFYYVTCHFMLRYIMIHYVLLCYL